MIEEKTKYRRTLTKLPIIINSGQTLSELADFGGMQLRCLLFPANWTVCDISFLTADKQDGSILYSLQNFDGLALQTLTIPLTNPLNAVPVIPYLFDSLPYLKLSCSVAQANDVVVTAFLEPIYQGIHG